MLRGAHMHATPAHRPQRLAHARTHAPCVLMIPIWVAPPVAVLLSSSSVSSSSDALFATEGLDHILTRNELDLLLDSIGDGSGVMPREYVGCVLCTSRSGDSRTCSGDLRMDVELLLALLSPDSLASSEELRLLDSTFPLGRSGERSGDTRFSLGQMPQQHSAPGQLMHAGVCSS